MTREDWNDIANGRDGEGHSMPMAHLGPAAIDQWMLERIPFEGGVKPGRLFEEAGGPGYPRYTQFKASRARLFRSGLVFALGTKGASVTWRRVRTGLFVGAAVLVEGGAGF